VACLKSSNSGLKPFGNRRPSGAPALAQGGTANNTWQIPVREAG